VPASKITKQAAGLRGRAAAGAALGEGEAWPPQLGMVLLSFSHVSAQRHLVHLPVSPASRGLRRIDTARPCHPP